MPKRLDSQFAALLVVMLLAIAIRVFYVDRPMRYDESWSWIEFARFPVTQIIADYHDTNNHVLNSLLMHFAGRLFGAEPWALRLGALFAGVLTVPAVYLAGKLFYNRAAGLLAAALTAISPPLVDFSVNARGYTMTHLMFVCLLIVAKLQKDQPTRGRWALFALLTALGFYAIPIMFYPMGIVAVWLLLSIIIEQRGRERWRQLGAALLALGGGAALTLLLYTPVLLNNRLEAITGMGHLQPLSWSAYWRQLPQIVREVIPPLNNVGWEWLPALPIVMSVCVLIAFALHRRLTRDALPIPVAVLLWLTPVILLYRSLPYARNWHFMLPLYFLMAAAGAAFVFQRGWRWRGGTWIFSATALALSGGLAWGLIQSRLIVVSLDTGRFNEAEALALYLKANVTPDDFVLIPNPYERNVDFYLLVHDASPMTLYTQYWPLDMGNVAPMHQRVFLFPVEGWTVQDMVALFRLGSPSRELIPEQVITGAWGAGYQLRFSLNLNPVLYWQPQILRFGGDVDGRLEKWETQVEDGYLDVPLANGAASDIQVDFQLIFDILRNTDDFELRLRASESGACSIRFDADGGILRVVQIDGAGAETLIAEYPLTSADQHWHRVEIGVKGDTLVVSLEGTQVAQARIAGLGAGGVQMIAPPGAQVRVSNLRIVESPP